MLRFMTAGESHGPRLTAILEATDTMLKAANVELVGPMTQGRAGM